MTGPQLFHVSYSWVMFAVSAPRGPAGTTLTAGTGVAVGATLGPGTAGAGDPTALALGAPDAEAGLAEAAVDGAEEALAGTEAPAELGEIDGLATVACRTVGWAAVASAAVGAGDGPPEEAGLALAIGAAASWAGACPAGTCGASRSSCSRS